MDTSKLSVATEHDLRNIKGVVYCIVFSDGDWYVGATMRTFIARYGTLELSRAVLATASIRDKAKTHQWKVYLLHTGINTLTELQALEESEIGEEHMTCPHCLNKQRGGRGRDGKSRVPVALMSPDGKIHNFVSQARAADRIGARPYQVCGLMQGKWRSVQGWTLPGTRGPVGSAIRRKPCTIIDPDGNSHEFASLGDAARAIGVGQTCIGLLCKGLNTTVRGWHLPNTKPRKYKKTVLLSPDGIVVEFPSRRVASEKIGCSSAMVSALMSGRESAAKGWTVAR